MSAALENAVEGIARLDSEGKHLSVNRAYADVLGYHSEDLIARSWTQTVHPEDIQKANAACQRMLREESVELEVRAIRNDGSVFWNQLMMVKAADQEGQWIGHFCFIKDISERKHAEESLRQSAHRLQVLSRRVLEVQEQERKHLARELHDEIGQILSTISVTLHTNMEFCSCNSRTRLEDGVRIVDQAIHQVHNLSLDLRPSMLDDLGLVATIRWHASRQSETGHFTVSFFVESSGERLPADLETACYRVVQEALTNVVRHAHARQVWIEFRQRESDVQLVVRDDGVGFNRDAVQREAARGLSFGVLGMQERVALLGGQMEITSTPGHGTSIQVVFPLTSQAILPENSFARQRRGARFAYFWPMTMACSGPEFARSSTESRTWRSSRKRVTAGKP